MALTNSNTYIEPTAGTSLNSARGQQNNSFRSLLTNFKSKGPPVSVNLTAAGSALGEVDGMLFRSEATNALYSSDSVHVKSSPVGGNFTRVGIGNRVENGIVALGANAKSYEIGELVATVSENGTLASNARLYLCTTNATTAGSTAGFLDVGAPQGYSIGTNDNVTFSGHSVTAIRYLATSNIAVGTYSPAYRADIQSLVATSARVKSLGTAATHDAVLRLEVGGTSANSKVNFGDSGSDNVGSIIYRHSNDTLYLRAGGADRAYLNSTGLNVTGTIVSSGSITTSADFNTTSDNRVKEDIVRIEGALDKVEKLSGYTFTYSQTKQRSTGVIAQEVQEVLPEAVSGEQTLSVAYGNMVGLLIEAIKELKAEIDDIKQKTYQ